MQKREQASLRQRPRRNAKTQASQAPPQCLAAPTSWDAAPPRSRPAFS